VKNHLLLAVAVAAVALAAALLAGPARPPAILGAGIASVTAMASLWGYGRHGRTASKPVQQALLVFVVMFLLRLVLIGVALAMVVRAGQSVVAFVIAFFVPYFAFTAIEGSLLASLGRRMGKPA
jgi:uncharacterized membrane protein YfbV (UPF0208 family)